jgi:murein L,D-transpeptidase YafK
MKRSHIIPISLVVGLLILAVVFRAHLRPLIIEAFQTTRDRKTVQDRVEQFGQSVRVRLAPYFDAANIHYPPAKLTLVGLKHEKKLEVWACGIEKKFKLIRTYPILGAGGRLGPKLRQGDRQVPEGLYRIESLNPNSRFHLSLKVNYPNEFDHDQASRENRTNLGGDIMIHGGRASIGCLAMGDETAEDLFVLAAQTGIENISVILSPVDFRKTNLPDIRHTLPEWTNALYGQLRRELSKLDLDSM